MFCCIFFFFIHWPDQLFDLFQGAPMKTTAGTLAKVLTGMQGLDSYLALGHVEIDEMS